ncbi:MAG: hypothetical protein ACTSU5_01160 [Promethearchaeota archaeon]
MTPGVCTTTNRENDDGGKRDLDRELALDLQDLLFEDFAADGDLQRADDGDEDRACKDLQFFLRRPFCCK